MKNFTLALLLLVFISASRTLAQPYQQSVGDYEEGIIYLKIVDSSIFEINYLPPPNYSGNNAGIYATFSDFGVTEVVKPFEVLGGTKFLRIYKVYFTQSDQVANFMAQLNSYPVVEYTEQVPRKEIYPTFPNDPSIPAGSYQLGLINAYDAFDLHTGGGALVAIVDDAVQVSHEDLEANIVLGWDAADLDNDPNPPFTGNNAASPNRFSHGTHVAGIAGAVTDNGIGVGSIGWNNQLMAVKTIRDNTLDPFIITHGYEGIAWAAANGADVINLSWGGRGFSQAEYDVVVAARQSGAIIVASAGNNLSAVPRYPAAYGEGTTGQPWEAIDSRLVIAVASIDANGDQSDWGYGLFGHAGSNFGPWVDVSAYGTAILSTLAGSVNGGPDNDNYGTLTGTSMAAPLVAGLAGLMVSYNPAASSEAIIDCLLGAANKDIYGPAHPSNLPSMLGAGRIDAFAALRCLASDCEDHPIAIITPSSPFICQGGEVQLTANEGESYLWSTGATTRSIVVNQAGIYSVTVSFAGGCTSTALIDIQPAITEATVIVTEISGNQAGDGILCGQDYLNLIAFWGLGYQWNAFNAKTQSIESIVGGANLPATWNYAVTVTGVGGCPGVTDVVTGTAVWLLPPVALISVEEASQTPDDGIICRGHSAVLTASGADSYVWSTGATTASITVSPTATTIYSVTVSDIHGCVGRAEFRVEVIECPLWQFTCPCTEANTLNIAASPSGTPYSSLGLPATLDPSMHNGCIAIAGRLIMDQHVTITGCDDLRMQPCAEIVVPAFRHLTMEYNTIYGCEQMWRRIRAEPYGYLTFRHNKVSDGQHVLWAEPVTPFGLLTPTRVDIQHNRFECNHISLHIPGSGGGFYGGVVWQTPFVGNNILCKGPGNTLGDLLPPCDAGLDNYDDEHGYAGAVVLGANFNVGTAGGALNTFSNLRNGVIGERAFLNVERSNFNNMIGFSDFQPNFTLSRGVGVVANNGIYNVRDANFNGAGHALSGSNAFFSLRRSTTNKVRVGIEAWSPASLRVFDNPGIRFTDSGIRAWNLAAVPGFSSHVIDNNKFFTQDVQAAFDGDWAIQLVNFGNLTLPDGAGRISRNEVYVNDQVGGLLVNNLNNWAISDNRVEFSAHPNSEVLGGTGIELQNSHYNYLYGNDIADVTGVGFNATTGFATLASLGNRFCCNSTEGNFVGWWFSGACFGTQYRQTDMASHDFSLWLPGNANTGFTVIGQQPPLGNATNSNRFGAASGTAWNDGPVPILNASQFSVTTQNTPHYPQQVVTPNGVPGDWFEVNGASSGVCATDANCPAPAYPPGGREEIEPTDILIAQNAFGSIVGGAALQWEGERDLYARLKAHPDMLGQSTSVDAFYSATEAGSAVRSFHIAETMVASVQDVPTAWGQALRIAADSIAAIEAEADAVLVALVGAGTRSDSLDIYWQSQSVRARLVPHTAVAIEKQHQMDSLRRARAMAALPVVMALPANHVPQSNRKDALRVYLEVISSGAMQLTEGQFDTISAIAHQCPLAGGSAVYTARALYQLNEQKDFDDFDLCAIVTERSAKTSPKPHTEKVTLWPNPSRDKVSVLIPGLEAENRVYIRVLDVSGRVVLQQIAVTTADGMFALDVSRLASGIYLCHIATNHRAFIPARLVISHP